MKRILILFLALTAAAAGLYAQPKPKSQKEAEALRTLFNAGDPDSRIQAGESALTNFADTEFKPMILFIVADSYQRKGDWEKAIVYGERALEADPKNYDSMILLSSTIASRTRENDLDKTQKLAKAEKYANDALATLKDAPKPNAGVTDDQWAAAKKDYVAQAHQALGMVAMDRKQYDVAVTEFKAAVESTASPDPAAMVRLAAAYNGAGKPDDAIAIVDKLNAMPDLNAAVKQYAQAEKARATALKNGGAKPSAAAAPSQVEIKKP